MVERGMWVESIDTHDKGVVVGVQGEFIDSAWNGIEGPDPETPYDGQIVVRWNKGIDPPIWTNQADVRVLESTDTNKI